MKLKKVLICVAAVSLLTTGILACGNKNSDSINIDTSAPGSDSVEEKDDVSESNWNYLPLYFSCPDFDIKGGCISWNEETKEWNAEFPTPYVYTVLGGTFTEDGKITLTQDNTDGHGEAYISGLEDELNHLRNGLKYAYLGFSCPDFDITGGIFAWDKEAGEWKAEFPTPYMYTVLSGSFTEDGKLSITQDNTDGHGDAYIPGLEDAFAKLLAGKMQAPLYFENDEFAVSDGIISWDTNEMTWDASFNTPYGETILGGTYTTDGTLTLVDDSTDGHAEADMPSIQEVFSKSLKGFYGDVEDVEVADLSELVAAYPGNAEEYDFDDLTEMDNSPLSGKSICILGSSVAYGQASGKSAVGEYLSARFGAELTKEAVSGTTLVDNGDTSYVQRMLNNIDSEAHFDLFVCQLSTNDAAKKLPLGEISDSMSGEDFDTSTITGAMEYIIWYAQKTWDCPVVFFTGSHYESEEYDAMVTRIEELKDKWGIGVLNLWSDEEFNNITDADRELYMSDDIHPTKAGYKLWWGPEQEKQLLEFLN